jgi:hypothetical protein
MGKQNEKLIKNMNDMKIENFNDIMKKCFGDRLINIPAETVKVSKCCGATFEEAEGSACCGAKISDSGLCYECKDHAETDGYVCDECDEWFEKPKDQ